MWCATAWRFCTRLIRPCVCVRPGLFAQALAQLLDALAVDVKVCIAQARRRAHIHRVAPIINSTSSTKRISLLLNSARKYPGASSTRSARGSLLIRALRRAWVCSGEPCRGSGLMACWASLAWLFTQFGESGQAAKRPLWMPKLSGGLPLQALSNVANDSTSAGL